MPIQLKASTVYMAKANTDGPKEEEEGDEEGIVTPENAEQEEEEEDKTGVLTLYNKRFNECLIKTLHLNKMKYQKQQGEES